MTDDAGQSEWATKADGWVLNQRIFDHAFTPFTSSLLGAVTITPGDRVLDVGCGAGTTLMAAADLGANTVGVDIAEAMVDAARRREPRASVHLCDAQVADLSSLCGPPPFDTVISRFGMMFFADPKAAFTNIRNACRSGAHLAFVCWAAGETDLFTYGLEPFRAELGDPPGPPVTDAPGPLGLATAGRIGDVLESAGWVDVSIESVVGTCDFGLDGSDGAQERLAVALAGSVGIATRAALLPVVGEQRWDELCEQAIAGMRSRATGDTVRFDSSAWLVTATNAVGGRTP